MRTAALVAVLLALAGCTPDEDNALGMVIPPENDSPFEIIDIYTAGDPVIRNIIALDETDTH
jgi:hypothetical protein